MIKRITFLLMAFASFAHLGWAQDAPTTVIGVDLSLSSDTLCPNDILVATPVLTGIDAADVVQCRIQWTSDTTAVQSSWHDSVASVLPMSLSSVELEGTCYIRVIVKDTVEDFTSPFYRVVVRENLTAPTITANHDTVCYNSSSSTLSITSNPYSAELLKTILFQWQDSTSGSEWNDVENATSDSFTADSLIATTWYRLFVKNGCDSVFSNAIEINVYNPLSPGLLMNDTSICNNSQAFLHFLQLPSGADSGYHYSWLMKDSDNKTVSIDNDTTVLLTDSLTADRWFRVVVTPAGCPGDTTAPIHVSVHQPFIVDAVSNDTSVCNGDVPLPISATFTGGEGSYTYQWYKKQVDSLNWNAIDTALNNTYQPGAHTSDWQYRLQATDFCGTVWSASILIHAYAILKAPQITYSGAATICYGATPSAPYIINEHAEGGNDVFSYQWIKKVGDQEWEDIQGATGDTLYPGSLTDTTKFRVVATSEKGCGSVFAGSKICVYPQFKAGSISSNDTVVCYNTAPTQSISIDTAFVGGNSPYTYNWQKKHVDSLSWTNIDNAHGSSYLPDAHSSDYMYRLEATDGCGDVLYSKNTVTVHALPSVVAPVIVAASDSICFGTLPPAITVSDTAIGGNNIFSYRWEWSRNGNSFDSLDAYTTVTSTYQASDTLQKNAWYRLHATTGCESVNSNVIQVKVRSQFMAGTIDGDTSVCYGTAPLPISLASPFTGSNGSYSYSWQKKAADSNVWTDIPSANGNSYSPGTHTSNWLYRLQATDACGVSLLSNSVLIQAHDSIHAPVISRDSIYFICYGLSAGQINVTPAVGGNNDFSYTWLWNNAETTWTVASSDNPLVSYQPTESLFQDASCSLIATTGCGSKTSNVIEFDVLPQFVAGVIGDDDTVCYHGVPNPFSITTPFSGCTGEYSYTWQKKLANGSGEWESIPDTDTTWYLAGNHTSDWQYQLSATDACGVTVSSNIIRVHTFGHLVPPDISYPYSGDTICYGSHPIYPFVRVNAQGGGGLFSYEWKIKRDSDANYVGTGDSDSVYLYSNPLYEKTRFRLYATSLAGCGDTFSIRAIINVYDSISRPRVTNTSIDTIYCYGSQPIVLNDNVAANGGNGQFAYQWQTMGDNGDWENTSSADIILDSFQPGNLFDTTLFRLRAINATCHDTSYSDTVQINVYNAIEPPIVNHTYNDTTYCYGFQPAAFINNLSATGSDGQFTYQWEKRTNNGEWGITSSADTNLYSYQPDTLYENTWYQLKAYNAYCNVTTISDSVMISVYQALQAPQISNITNHTLCYGDTAKPYYIAIPAYGGNGQFSYQWGTVINGIFNPIDGETGDTLNLGQLFVTTKYQLLASSLSGCGETYSNSSTIRVYDEFVPASITAEQPGVIETELINVCYQDGYWLFRDNATGGDTNNYYYSWYESYDGIDFQAFDSTSNAARIDSTANISKYYMLVSNNKCGTGTSNQIFVNVNPLPDYHLLYGDSSIHCSNMSDLEYWVDADDNEMYTWSIDSFYGEFLSDNDSSNVLIHWNDGIASAELTLDIRFIDTYCHKPFSYNITIDTVNHAPDKTHIVMKKGARILICADTTPDAHYEWGYIEINSGVETMIPNSDYRYVQIPVGLDTNNYDFFVEIWYGKTPCKTRTYYRKDEHGDDWWSDNSAKPTFKMMPNPSQGDVFYTLDANIDGVYQIDVYNTVGKLVYSQNDSDFIKDTSVRLRKHLDPGIYLVTVTTSNGVLTQKIIVK